MKLLQKLYWVSVHKKTHKCLNELRKMRVASLSYDEIASKYVFYDTAEYDLKSRLYRWYMCIPTEPTIETNRKRVRATLLTLAYGSGDARLTDKFVIRKIKK